MQRNVAGQKLTLFAFDSVTNLPKVGDAPNIVAYVSVDDGPYVQLADGAATEDDATIAAGSYSFDLAAAEIDGTKLKFTGVSVTAGVVVLPLTVYTTPPNFNVLDVGADGSVTLGAIADETALRAALAAALAAYGLAATITEAIVTAVKTLEITVSPEVAKLGPCSRGPVATPAFQPEAAVPVVMPAFRRCT